MKSSNRRLPNREQHSGFIAQNVYDSEQERISPSEIKYNQTQVDNLAELERRYNDHDLLDIINVFDLIFGLVVTLEDASYAVGARILELLCHREKGNRRETRLLGILSFIHSTIWKVLFGNVADSLEKGTEHEDEYMISEKELLVSRFISMPKDMGAFNCQAYFILKGVLDNAGFPAVVSAHFVPVEWQQRPRTTILIKFAEEKQKKLEGPWPLKRHGLVQCCYTLDPKTLDAEVEDEA
ncbi:Hypothetical predicted protein [Olea europaea subsp. europaea]|uniref:Trafficking protein particle complex subunit n=1 Tax=Olea europaea subsp. europaea TaxID=158383 RepID=A0A8S0SZY0_OLEEU|nr:Hypothetical predicted protein [Olea europaea subsp. europaea]